MFEIEKDSSLFPSLHFSGRDVPGDGKKYSLLTTVIAELHCTQNRNKVQEHYVQKTGEKPNADREHIFYLNKFFFFFRTEQRSRSHCLRTTS